MALAGAKGLVQIEHESALQACERVRGSVECMEVVLVVVVVVVVPVGVVPVGCLDCWSGEQGEVDDGEGVESDGGALRGRLIWVD